MIILALIFLVGCAKVESDKELPPYLKEPIEKEIKAGLEKELLEQQQKAYERIYGVFVNQGLILSKIGGGFDVKVKNNDVAGNFEIKIEKTKTVSGNDINFGIAENSFYLAANSEKIIKVDAKPIIESSYKYRQDFFPIKIIASKDGKQFSEANIIITVNV